MGPPEFISQSRKGVSARARKPSVIVLWTVKSFEVLSVRVRSSGNSEATIPHNRRATKEVTRIFRTVVRATILQPLQLIYLIRIIIKGIEARTYLDFLYAFSWEEPNVLSLIERAPDPMPESPIAHRS